MKKLMIAVVFVFVGVLFVTPCLAAWEYNVSMTGSWNQSVSGSYIIWVEVAATSDGTDPAAILLSTYITADNIKKRLRGAFLYLAETDPGSPAPDAWGVTISSDLGGAIFTLTGLSTATTEFHNSDISAFYPVKDDLQIDFGDIGDNGDKAAIRLHFMK